MTDWAGFWVAIGFAAGCWFLGMGLEEFGEQIVRAVRHWKNGPPNRPPADEDWR